MPGAWGRWGFRIDWDAPAGDTVTVQGDAYDGSMARFGPVENIRANGGNVLGRWSRQLAGNSDVKLQLYYDQTHGAFPGSFTQDIGTYDLDFQHHRPLGPAHDFVCGASATGWWRTTSSTRPANAFLPAQVDHQLFSAFAQDEITLRKDQLHLTLGTKIERNDLHRRRVGTESRGSRGRRTKSRRSGPPFRAPCARLRASTAIFIRRLRRRIGSRAAPTWSRKNWRPVKLATAWQLDPQLGLSLATFTTTTTICAASSR